VATHSKNQFIDVNVLGTQTLLEVAIKNHLKAFVYTSTTSTFGGALTHHPENEAVWVTEDLRPIPKNIYGVTKLASEDLCQLAFKEQALPCIVLKTSRFFPEEDDMKHTMPDFSQESIAAQEFLYRRVDIEDVVTAHQLAIEHSKKIGFDKFIISATTPFQASDCQLLRKNAPEVIECYYPGAAKRFEELGWKMFQAFDRVYVNTKARTLLGWNPRYNFQTAMDRGRSAKGPLSDLAYEIGRKGYHP
jgi:UDP-glucose 4-epimerase